ncbi:T6SS phospholipase effector Tle1-like catalytic domain-containing protein [Roseateles sp. BYS180W]|uniref:T6SS phospholipase effector Tle1-like catalytic domain-containing protein n=1 Tax=Roseateles rivi TaxID=3299028 RepID=A0ABW7FS98_9BURK
MTQVKPPQPAQRAQARVGALARLRKAGAVSQGACAQPSCTAQVQVGFFFDGTNNNKKRDQEDVPDPNKRSHTNVVVLHDAFHDERPYKHRVYVPGVGTPFPEIGEHGELPEGKAMGRGGEARIHWAMFQAINAICRAAIGSALLGQDEIRQRITGAGFLGGDGLTPCSDGRRNGVFSGVLRQLASAIENAKPRITSLQLSVFGFSRGAAEARAFCHWMSALWTEYVDFDMFLEGKLPNLRIQFVGLFDTVASVGVAKSAPVRGPEGLMGWADGTLELPSRVERCVHYVAAHEIRQSFPLSTAARSHCTVHEVMYPGAHSDVGGGYAPRDQGKGLTRADLLSQVPLLHMYREAREAGVPLADSKALKELGRDETDADLKISPDLIRRFNAYVKQGPKGGLLHKALAEHMRWYWRWRLAVGGKLSALRSYAAASAQDQEDLRASEQDFQRDVVQAFADRDAAVARRTRPVVATLNDAAAQRRGQLSQLSEAEMDVIAEKLHPKALSAEVAELFDQHIHDSHASFYLVGPTTAQERRELIAGVQARQREGEALNGFERRVLALQQTRPGELPTITDKDYEDIVSRAGAVAEPITRAMTVTRTRRESQGHVRWRVVLERS